MKATQARLRELFNYDPLTGVMTRRIGLRGTQVGRVVGTLSHRGYLKVCIDREYCEVHRVIWKWLHDEEPIQIDHRDRVRNNNRENNLRAATHRQNQGNKAVQASLLGVKGVYLTRNGQRYRTVVAGKHIGTFDTIALASAAYCQVAAAHFGSEFVHAP